MTTYTLASGEVNALLNKVVQRWHQDLDKFQVRIGILMAHNDNGAAVKSGGYPAFAMVKPVPLKDKITKGYDVEMLIDADAWENMKPRHRAALLDHECSHLVVAMDTDAPTQPKLDDLGRPVVKTKKADYSAGDGFRAVVARHGRFAIEHLNLTRAKAIVDGGENDHLKDLALAADGNEDAAKRLSDFDGDDLS